MSDSDSLFGKLQGRRVVRAAIAHVLVAWLFVQIADVVLPYLGIVDQPVRWALVVSIATFPVTLFIAWLSDAGRRSGELVALVLVAVMAGWWVTGNLPDEARERTSLVVMPFDYGDDVDNQGLSRALTQEISSLLMKSHSIDVIGQESARSSVLQGLGAIGIADRLGVGSVLSGSVSSQGGSMRIELRLLSAAGEATWESVIEDSIANMFAVQERIASEIESRLGAGDDVVPVSQVAAERCWMPTDAEALRKYYTARYYLEIRSHAQTSRQQIADAIRIYEDLLDQYPSFSDARSGLAWSLYRQWQWFPEDSRFANHGDGQLGELAQRAYDDCPGNVEALHMLPNQYDHDNEWIGQYRQLKAFMEVEPHKSEHRERLTGQYRMTGNIALARELAEQNLALNPLSVNAIKNLGMIEQYHGNLDEAAALYERMAELGWNGPNFARQQKFADECGWQADCMAEKNVLWPALVENLDLLRIVTRVPSNDRERQESIDAAMAMYEKNPADTVNTLNTAACRFEHLTPLFFETWEAFKRDSDTVRMNWYWPNGWVDACIDVWSDPRFVDYAEEAGFVEFWRAVEWPEFCQPRGEGFACGRNIASSPGPRAAET